MKQNISYRESHTEPGKGKIYHDSFSLHIFRKQMWNWEMKILQTILQGKLSEKNEVLDFACGTGRIINFLKTFTENLTGIDVSDTMLEVARKNNPEVNLVKADLTKDNQIFGEKKFDIITSFRFFLNAEDSLRNEVLQALHSILKEDGIFIFNNHANASGPGPVLGKLIISLKNFFGDPGKKKVYNLLSEKKLRKMLANNGFEIINSFHRSVIPIMNEKTKFNVSKLEKLEDFFSSYSFFRPFARNIIYVCKKNNKSGIQV